jgi:hypothetical protein
MPQAKELCALCGITSYKDIVNCLGYFNQVGFSFCFIVVFVVVVVVVVAVVAVADFMYLHFFS